jgi:hypothetical protein
VNSIDEEKILTTDCKVSYACFPSMMRFEDEPAIRSYPEVHPLAPLWGFFGQCLYQRLELTADRAGVIDLPAALCQDLPRAVAFAVGCDDVEWVARYLPRLMDGPNPAAVIKQDHYLVLTSYCDAQYSSLTGAAAQRWSGKKQQDLQRAVEMQLINGMPAKTA